MSWQTASGKKTTQITLDNGNITQIGLGTKGSRPTRTIQKEVAVLIEPSEEKQEETDVTIIGKNISIDEDIIIEDEMRERGMYVLGVQGTGKSSFLETIIHQDICKGNAVIVIDPHGDLVDHVIAQLPEERVENTYLLDIEDTKYPFGINLFAAPLNSSISGQTIAVERLMHVFERVFPLSARMLLDKYLENIALVFLENPGYTMKDIPRFLSDEELRHELIQHLKNDYIRDFWLEFDTLPAGRKREEVAALNNRLNTFLNKPMVRNIIGQKTSTIDFRRAIQEREILLIKLPIKKYKMIASLIGTMLVAQIHAVTFSFANKPRSQRPGFSLFVDEFQNFATLDFAELFTEARKYKARQTVAHQFTKQISLDELQEATTTAYTIVAFRTTEYDARAFASSFSDFELYPGIQHIPRPDLSQLRKHKNKAVSDFWARYVRRWQEADNKEPKRQREDGYTHIVLPTWNLGFGDVEYQPKHVRAALSILEDLFYHSMLEKKLDENLSNSLLNIVMEWYYDDEIDQFISHLSHALNALIQEPMGETKETTTSDIASHLQHLPNYTALVRVGYETHQMKPLPIPENVVNGDDLWQRVRQIRIQTAKKYGRKREEVEASFRAEKKVPITVVEIEGQDDVPEIPEQKKRSRYEDA